MITCIFIIIGEVTVEVWTQTTPITFVNCSSPWEQNETTSDSAALCAWKLLHCTQSCTNFATLSHYQVEHRTFTLLHPRPRPCTERLQLLPLSLPLIAIKITELCNSRSFSVINYKLLNSITNSLNFDLLCNERYKSVVFNTLYTTPSLRNYSLTDLLFHKSVRFCSSFVRVNKLQLQ